MSQKRIIASRSYNIIIIRCETVGPDVLIREDGGWPHLGGGVCEKEMQYCSYYYNVTVHSLQHSMISLFHGTWIKMVL